MTALATVTALSVAIAAAMTIIVLRIVLRERRRSAARVAALEADIYRTEDEDIILLHDAPLASAQTTVPFAAAPPALKPVPRSTTLPLVPLLGVAAAIVLGIAIGAVRSRATADDSRAPAAAASDPAIELVSLHQEQSDDHLTVRGVVRNPPQGREMDHLTAVVLLFNQQGGFLTSGRSPIESPALPPGSEANFVVTVPGAANVGKYRVSFRNDDRVVPHVDRRW